MAEVNLKQQLDVIDYFGALAVFVIFFAIVFVLACTCILWFCVGEVEKETVFTKVLLKYAEKIQNPVWFFFVP